MKHFVFCSRCNNRLRRPSSDEISTPTSLRSRSSSLLSSDYIAEENEANVGVQVDNEENSVLLMPLLPPPTFKGSASNSVSRRTSSASSHSSVGSKNSNEMANDIDRLVKLVHELKEEDLNSYKRKIAERESSKHRRGSSEESCTSESLPPTLDLQKVLVPTTTRIINAIPHQEPSERPSKSCPIVLELANASLDLMLTPDSKIIYSKASSPSDLSNHDPM